jgi:hypothetical protein
MSAAGPNKKLNSNSLALKELARLEDLFLTSFEDAVEKGIPEDAAGLKRLRADLESILTEANKRTKLLAIELTKIYDMVSCLAQRTTPLCSHEPPPCILSARFVDTRRSKNLVRIVGSIDSLCVVDPAHGDSRKRARSKQKKAGVAARGI